MGTEFEPTELASLADILSSGVKRVSTFFDDWFGPWTPPPASAPTSAEGRSFDYPTGWNLRRVPRSEEGRHSVAELRNLSKIDIVRLCLETRKDILSKAEFSIVPRRKVGETAFQAKQRGFGDPRIQAIADFLRYPDREHDFLTWTRLLLDDALVLDAPTVYCRKKRNHGVYSLEVIDGGTITRYLDPTGRTPQPPMPAYGQWIKAAPYKNYTTDRMLYYPRNPQTNLVYGLSPVEQIILTTNIILNRNISQLAAYTVSNIPTMFIKSPKDWKPSDIKDFQVWFDSVLAGNVAERTKAIYIPDASDPIVPNKDSITDDADEWFSRLVCYCFGVSPNWFIKQQSRASSESFWQQADEEGALPWLRWYKAFLDLCIAKFFEASDLEINWVWERKPLPLQQSQILGAYVTNGILTRDEARHELGYDPLTPEQQAQVQEQTQVQAQGAFGDDKQRPEEEGNHRADHEGARAPRGDNTKDPALSSGVIQS